MGLGRGLKEACPILGWPRPETLCPLHAEGRVPKGMCQYRPSTILRRGQHLWKGEVFPFFKLLWCHAHTAFFLFLLLYGVRAEPVLWSQGRASQGRAGSSRVD